MPRFDTLPGIGRVRVYDAGPNAGFMDRYLVLFEDFEVYNGQDATTPTRPRPYGPRQSLAMSPNPDHAQGVSSWDEAVPPWTYGPKLYQADIRFRRIPFSSLPENVQRHVIARATED